MVVLVSLCIVGSLSVFASVDQDGREYFVEGLELNSRHTRNDCDVESPDLYARVKTPAEVSCQNINRATSGHIARYRCRDERY